MIGGRLDGNIEEGSEMEGNEIEGNEIEGRENGFDGWAELGATDDGGAVTGVELAPSLLEGADDGTLVGGTLVGDTLDGGALLGGGSKTLDRIELRLWKIPPLVEALAEEGGSVGTLAGADVGGSVGADEGADVGTSEEADVGADVTSVGEEVGGSDEEGATILDKSLDKALPTDVKALPAAEVISPKPEVMSPSPEVMLAMIPPLSLEGGGVMAEVGASEVGVALVAPSEVCAADAESLEADESLVEAALLEASEVGAEEVALEESVAADAVSDEAGAGVGSVLPGSVELAGTIAEVPGSSVLVPNGSLRMEPRPPRVSSRPLPTSPLSE